MAVYTIQDQCDAGKRLDVYLSGMEENLSRSHIQKLLKEGCITVNGEAVKAGSRLGIGDVIRLDLPEPVPLEVLPEDIPLDILYEDRDVLVVNKPKGMVVHPAYGNFTGTLANALCYYLGGREGAEEPAPIPYLRGNNRVH